MSNLKINDPVTTPNGPGVVAGNMYDQGTMQIMVRHKVPQMTGHEAGKCLTAKAVYTTLFIYEPEQVATMGAAPAKKGA